MSDYFDTRIDLLLGRSPLLLPPRQTASVDATVRTGATVPRLAAAAPPPPIGRAATPPSPRPKHNSNRPLPAHGGS